MPHIVRRYNNEEDYLDTFIVGTPVSATFKTWDEAERVRDLLREGESRYYYNITHTASCAVITKGEPS
jgi:hypothetical protein